MHVCIRIDRRAWILFVIWHVPRNVFTESIEHCSLWQPHVTLSLSPYLKKKETWKVCLLLLENNKGESNDKDIKEQFTIRDITKSEHKVNREKKKKRWSTLHAKRGNDLLDYELERRLSNNKQTTGKSKITILNKAHFNFLFRR